MDRVRQWSLLAGLLAVVILAAGWFLVVSPKRQEAATVQAQADAQVSTNDSLAAQLAILRQKAVDLPRQQAALAAVAQKVPATRALASLIRALSVASKSAGVELVSIIPGGTSVAAVTTATAPTAPTAPAAPAAAPAVRAGATSAAGQLGTIPIALSVVGTYFQVEQFLNQVENLPRAMRVTSLTLGPGPNPVSTAHLPSAPVAGANRTLVAAIAAQAYTAVGRPAPIPAAVPVVPAAPGTPVSPSPVR